MSTDTQSFSNLLTTEIELLNNLHSLMQEEQRTVEDNKVEQLIPIAERKNQLLEQVEQASRKREQFLLSAVQAGTIKERLEMYINQASDGRQLQKQMSELEGTLRRCHDQNEVNAMIITMNQRHVERNLNIMKGIDNNSMTYNAKGGTEARSEQLRGVKA